MRDELDICSRLPLAVIGKYSGVDSVLSNEAVDELIDRCILGVLEKATGGPITFGEFNEGAEAGDARD